MAKLRYELSGNFDEVLNRIDAAVMHGSMTASLEESENFRTANMRCAVCVYERYSMVGSNRVSMNVTLIEADGRLFVTVMTSGGSQAILFKLNTLGEEAFLDTVRDAIEPYIV